jgi:hypothetical protein
MSQLDASAAQAKYQPDEAFKKKVLIWGPQGINP